MSNRFLLSVSRCLNCSEEICLYLFFFGFFGGFVQQETLCEMNDELQESARETELELRESLDLATAKTIEANRRLDAMKENIVDYETTINKFRDLVAQLKVRRRPYLQVFDSLGLMGTWGRGGNSNFRWRGPPDSSLSSLILVGWCEEGHPATKNLLQLSQG